VSACTDRIGSAFETAAAAGRGALIIYICAGDPDLATTVEVACAAAQAGASIIELGIPYSDPLADGPVIQAAGQRALRAGTTVAGVLEAARQVRARSDVPLVMMTCFNPILQFGPEAFAARAAEVGVDAILVSDLPPEESDEWLACAERAGLGTVFLVAPTTSPERLPNVASHSTAFVYAVSRPGTTGERADLPEDLGDLVAAIRRHTMRPVVVGFGISTPEQVRTVCAVADGAVVGSAVVRLIAQQADRAGIVAAVRAFVAELAAGASRE
jgi:tryptophan synthase alpha chain